MCIMPVGDGAIRVRTGRSDIEGLGDLEKSGGAAATAAAPLSMRIPRGPSLGRVLGWLMDQAEAQVTEALNQPHAVWGTLQTPLTSVAMRERRFDPGDSVTRPVTRLGSVGVAGRSVAAEHHLEPALGLA